MEVLSELAEEVVSSNADVRWPVHVHLIRFAQSFAGAMSYPDRF